MLKQRLESPGPTGIRAAPRKYATRRGQGLRQSPSADSGTKGESCAFGAANQPAARTPLFIEVLMVLSYKALRVFRYTIRFAGRILAINNMEIRA
jgi:hypothetical protein